MNRNEENAYVVCCEPGIILFGYATPGEIKSESPTLKRARMLLYYPTETHGVFGAVANGPFKGSRVSPAVDEHTIRTKVECHTLCSQESADVWESEPWSIE